jgi:ParB family chromosome partitioning protein
MKTSEKTIKTIVWAGSPELATCLVPIGTLRKDPKNARAHDEASHIAIADSYRAFGQRKTIVTTADGVVVAGNGQLEAARRLGWTHIAVASTAGMTDDQVRAYALADNRTSELSAWEPEALAVEIRALADHNYDVSGLGWSAAELQAIDPIIQPTTFPELNSKDRDPLQQMAFILHDEQVALVKAALSKAKGLGPFVSKNGNSNGNAIARICEMWLKENP